MSGMIHIYKGDGQGKTSAAVGLAVRCAGSGQKVLFTSFLKGGSSSEIRALACIPNISFAFSNVKHGFLCAMDDDELEKIQYASYLQDIIQTTAKNGIRLLILDEIFDACNYQIINQEDVVHFLKTKPKNLEVVMTGHYPSQILLGMADYISNLQKVKHPYDRGCVGRLGIEF